MTNPNPDAEAALRKLGQRIRQGFAEKYPLQEKAIETVKEAVREQYREEQSIKSLKKPAPSVEKSPKRHPPEPEQER